MRKKTRIKSTAYAKTPNSAYNTPFVFVLLPYFLFSFSLVWTVRRHSVKCLETRTLYDRNSLKVLRGRVKKTYTLYRVYCNDNTATGAKSGQLSAFHFQRPCKAYTHRSTPGQLLSRIHDYIRGTRSHTFKLVSSFHVPSLSSLSDEGLFSPRFLV